jgi:predicted flap endonuclease-1-like 5' DNA nuclease
VSYLVSQILPLLVAALLVGVVLGWYVARWFATRGSADVDPAADSEALAEADEMLAERDQQLTELRAELDRRNVELTAARRQLADINSAVRDTVGLEAELIAARELAEKVPGLQAQVAQLTAELSARSLPDATPGADDVVLDLREPPAEAAGLMWRGDDLTEIDGITPSAAEALRARGIMSFAQLANLSPTELAELDASLGPLAGEATRQSWVGKAAERVARQRFGVSW